MQVEVLTIQGKPTGRTVELPEDMFGIEPNDHAIYLAVKQFLAHQRQGNAKVKGRSEVKGSSRKLHKQKGTGGSRKGNIRNPLYKGGGTVHGPQPRDYTFKLNRKVKDLAKFSALTYKAKGDAIRVVENFDFAAPKTKLIVELLQGLNATDKKVLLVSEEYNKILHLSARNLPKVKTSLINDINTYGLMNTNLLVLSEGTIKLISETEEELSEA